MKRRTIISFLTMCGLVFGTIGLTSAESQTPRRSPVVKPRVKVAPPAKTKRTRKVKPAVKKPKVVLETNMGNITIELNPTAAPKTVRNFLAYVKSGFYNGTIFHRVIDGFMIQGGGYNQSMRKKRTRPAIALEAKNGLSNLRGTIAMARTNDPNSATSQFFINVVDNKNLDSYGGGYAVFGRVTQGMNVVDKIRKLPTAPQKGQPNAPSKTVVIRKAKLTR